MGMAAGIQGWQCGRSLTSDDLFWYFSLSGALQPKALLSRTYIQPLLVMVLPSVNDMGDLRSCSCYS